jgi:hypothetical protein
MTRRSKLAIPSAEVHRHFFGHPRDLRPHPNTHGPLERGVVRHASWRPERATGLAASALSGRAGGLLPRSHVDPAYRAGNGGTVVVNVTEDAAVTVKTVSASTGIPGPAPGR